MLYPAILTPVCPHLLRLEAVLCSQLLLSDCPPGTVYAGGEKAVMSNSTLYSMYTVTLSTLYDYWILRLEDAQMLIGQ